TGDGKIVFSAVGGVPPYAFSYTRDGLTVSPAQGDTAFNLIPASYTAIVTDANNCTASTLVNVGAPPVDVYAAYADTTSCFGPEYRDGRIRITGLTIENAPYRFRLNNGEFSTTGIFDNLAAGWYTIHAVNNFGCDTSFSIEVPQPLPASVDIVPDDTTVLMGSTLQLKGYLKPYGIEDITAYEWSPDNGLSCVDCYNPILYAYAGNTYTLTIRYRNNCFAQSTVRIKVLNNEELYVPNVFSPNKDGFNDRFEVFGKGIKDFNLKIFNRWGEKIFETNNQYDSWDGTYKGVLQEPGVYTYVLIVTYLDNKEINRKGTVTLIR
ncbi:MAG: gliding motility-associated C-terminal domain-containing protein, partial [Chitinophagales bacterium]|nr:gliding motility-associated C-terminal domain-containing protein [Chitinophagales bacterium]MDW8274668.1 gliding motility-associated C-terminal domain-containing protein [Chitinophagales bacterium]